MLRHGTGTSRSRARLLLCLLLVAAPIPGAAQSPTAEEAGRILHLLSRATYGARPADLVAVAAQGRGAWLERQLEPRGANDAALDARLAVYASLRMSMADRLRAYWPARAAAADTIPRERNASPGAAATTRPAQAVRGPRRLLGELVMARLTRAVYAERQLEEVMTEFWFNHFNVFFNKGLDRFLVADYERTAIRAHVFGRFQDMLVATAQHPAMLFYLDNWTSVAPDSLNRRMRRRPDAPPRRERGINENYARELLELHTLGVDGGYTQKDVVEVARALTGWTFARPGQGRFGTMAAGRRAGPARNLPDEVRFVFHPLLHDTGDKVVLGRVLPAGRGIEDGLEVLRTLAHHPATAHFLAGKLVQRFVTDEPASELVDEIAHVFLQTGGDLRAVTRALFTSERFYDARYRGASVKTPFDLVASALRLTQAELAPSRRLIETLRAFGHLPYGEPAPTGYPAASEDWVNSGAMLSRMTFGITLAAGGMDGVRLDAVALADGESVTEGAGLSAMLHTLLPGASSEKLAAGIRAELAREARGATAARALGLILGSPDFQRR